jgi:hypothetical protein
MKMLANQMLVYESVGQSEAGRGGKGLVGRLGVLLHKRRHFAEAGNGKEGKTYTCNVCVSTGARQSTNSLVERGLSVWQGQHCAEAAYSMCRRAHAYMRYCVHEHMHIDCMCTRGTRTDDTAAGGL